MPPLCYLKGDRVLHLPTLKQERLRDANFLATDEGVRSPDFTNYGVLPRLAGEAIDFIETHAAAAPERPFFLYTALTSPHLPVVTNQEYRGKSRAGDYGDFVVETDAFLGALLETLDRLRLADDTLVLFTSDNGGLYHYWEPKEADDVKHYKVTGAPPTFASSTIRPTPGCEGRRLTFGKGGTACRCSPAGPAKPPRARSATNLST